MHKPGIIAKQIHTRLKCTLPFFNLVILLLTGIKIPAQPFNNKMDEMLPLVAGVKITASPAGPVCAGTAVTFTAQAINATITPPYQWKKNGIITGTNSSTYTASDLLSSDIITCTMYSGGNLNLPVISNPVQLRVNPSPAIPAITTNGPAVFCQWTYNNMNYLKLSTVATGVTYQWLKNNSPTGFTGNSFTLYPGSTTISQPVTYNVVLKVTANGCSANSAIIPVTVLPNPSSSIIASGPTSFCQGTGSVTLSSSVPAVAYEWRYGSTLVVGTGPTYTVTTELQTGLYKLYITASNGCKTHLINATSSSIDIDVYYGSKPVIWKNNNKLEVYKNNMAVLSGNRKWYDYYGNLVGTAFYLFPASPGYYKVQVSNPNCTTLFSDYILYQPIPEKYSLYPSLITNTLHLTSNSLTNAIKVTITNNAGIVMLQNHNFTAMTTLNTSAYPSGIYTIQFTNLNTGVVDTKNFIRQ